jgi:miniconductance mechanosensitive channel
MELINKIEDQFINILSQNIGISEINAGYLYALIALLVIIGVGWIANFIVKRFVLGLVRSLIKKSKTSIGEHLIEQKFFHRLSHLAPAFIISSLSGVVFSNYLFLHELVEIVVNLYLVVIALSVIDSLINALYKVSEDSKIASKLPSREFVRQLRF